mmetsp:Transcript_48687/g.72252  ORF Transcript_48687/g.72252 Transcript_48687/m.72252 type:complete len:305 (-) Transcript_48687:108-1022(-)
MGYGDGMSICTRRSISCTISPPLVRKHPSAPHVPMIFAGWGLFPASNNKFPESAFINLLTGGSNSGATVFPNSSSTGGGAMVCMTKRVAVSLVNVMRRTARAETTIEIELELQHSIMRRSRLVEESERGLVKIESVILPSLSASPKLHITPKRSNALACRTGLGAAESMSTSLEFGGIWSAKLITATHTASFEIRALRLRPLVFSKPLSSATQNISKSNTECRMFSSASVKLGMNMSSSSFFLVLLSATTPPLPSFNKSSMLISTFCLSPLAFFLAFFLLMVFGNKISLPLLPSSSMQTLAIPN